MIKFNKVTYCYDNLMMVFDFAIKRHERVAILGRSGAGKSTLLSLIAGFIYPNSGTIKLAGHIVTDLPPAKRPASILFQENNLFTHLTVEQNIALGLSTSLRLSTTEKKELLNIVERTGLTELVKRYPKELSGGQRQRVALARCLVQDRPILLLDEPFSSLDPILRKECLDLVNEICEDYQLTLLIVTHHFPDAKLIAPRSIVIDEGKVIFDDKTNLLINNNL